MTALPVQLVRELAHGVSAGVSLGTTLGVSAGVAPGVSFGEPRWGTYPQVSGSPGQGFGRNLSPFAGPSSVGPGNSESARRRRSPSPAPPPPRVNARVEWLQSRLSARDWAILETIYRACLATSTQIQRVHFFPVASAVEMRKRTLRRLVESGALANSPRRIGGPLGGSQQRVWALDPAARILIQNRLGTVEGEPMEADSGRALRFVQHTLTVTELYVQCVEMARTGAFDVIDFWAEPQCWWPLGNRRYIKPDAYLCLGLPGTDEVDHWWIEVDMGTERNPVMRDKFLRYLRFDASGQEGPGGVSPRVLVTTPDRSRASTLKRIRGRMGQPAADLITILPFEEATAFLATYTNRTE